MYCILVDHCFKIIVLFSHVVSILGALNYKRKLKKKFKRKFKKNLSTGIQVSSCMSDGCLIKIKACVEFRL